MTEAGRVLQERLNQELEEHAGQFAEQCIEEIRTTQGHVTEDLIAIIKQVGPLFYKAGAAHVFMNFECYPRKK